jgi:hypothetical protein
MSLAICEISLSSANVSNNQSLISNRDGKLSFSGVDRYDFDNDVYAKNVKLANETDIQNLQNEIDNILPLSNYAYINGNDETSQLGGIPFGTGSINTLIQSPDFLYDNINKVVKVDNINLATQTQIDTLQTEIDNIPVPNPDALITDTPLIVPTQGSVIISNGLTATGTNKSEDLIIRDYDGIDVYKQLNVNSGLNIQSLTTLPVVMTSGTDYFTINNGQGSGTRFIGSSFYLFDNNIISTQNVILNQGNSLTLNNDTDPDNVKLYKANGANGTFFIDNQSGSKTNFKNASEYVFDNSLSIGNLNTSNKIFLNGSQFNGVSAGLLRSINCNLFKPTIVYDVVWNNLSPQQQLEWKGLDPSYSSPIQSLTGNYWSFVKSTPGPAKVGWFIPVDLSSLTFQDLESFWCVVRFNNNTSISTEGSLFFSIYTSPATAPNFYRTRINYQNPGTAINQTGYFYKIHCQDTITTTTAGNSGRAQEVGQTKFKTNPCEVRPDLWHIPFNKVPVLSGDTSAGYTNAPILAISLQTASNIHTYDFDVVSIGYLNVQYNLSFA